MTTANIPESYVEHRQTFASPWISQWTIPNPFIELLLPVLRGYGVELTDVAFNKEAKNVGETYLNIGIRKLNAAIKIGLDHLTFVAANPDWSMAPQFVELFDGISSRVWRHVAAPPASQQITLALHVSLGDASPQEVTSRLINRDVLGDAGFYGISVHRDDCSLVIDKSLRYDAAAFIRVQRTFSGPTAFSDIALQLYDDEKRALELLGIMGID